VLRRIFGPKRNEVQEWRKLHNEELNDLYSLGDQIEKKEMSGACSSYGGEEVHTGIWWGNLKEKDHLEEPGMDGRIILRWIFREWNGGGIDWIVLAQDRDRLQALVNVVVFRFHKMQEIS